MSINTVAQMVKAIARSWKRPLLWIALPGAIVGHDPANAQILPVGHSRDLTVLIEPGGRGREIAHEARREMGLLVATQAIEATRQACDPLMPDGVIHFEPPTDDDVGETGSGATRSLCVGVLALLPAGNADPSQALMFSPPMFSPPTLPPPTLPPQRRNPEQPGPLELFVSINSGSPDVNPTGLRQIAKV